MKNRTIRNDVPSEEIQTIIDYGYIDEEEHFKENDEPYNHIFHSFKKVNDWLENLNRRNQTDHFWDKQSG